jgi:putative chitinase
MNIFIQHFQQQHGLIPDGALGKETLHEFRELWQIPTDAAVAHLAGNAYHETAGFTRFTENLNYSAERLLEVFPKYFKSWEVAARYARKPDKIANRVYGSRLGNGDEASGDGWKYRGRGTLQVRGKENYKRLGQQLSTDFLTNPELVATNYALDSAVFFFELNKLWDMASTVDDVAIKKVRKKINGSDEGLKEVNQLVKHFYEVLKR